MTCGVGTLTQTVNGEPKARAPSALTGRLQVDQLKISSNADTFHDMKPAMRSAAATMTVFSASDIATNALVRMSNNCLS